MVLVFDVASAMTPVLSDAEKALQEQCRHTLPLANCITCLREEVSQLRRERGKPPFRIHDRVMFRKSVETLVLDVRDRQYVVEGGTVAWEWELDRI